MPHYSDQRLADRAFGGLGRRCATGSICCSASSARRPTGSTITATLYDPDAAGWIRDAEGASPVCRDARASSAPSSWSSTSPSCASSSPIRFADITAKVRAGRRRRAACPSSICCPRSRTSNRRACGSPCPIPIPTAKPRSPSARRHDPAPPADAGRALPPHRRAKAADRSTGKL